MFMDPTFCAPRHSGPDAVAIPGSPRIAEPTARALHARLLQNAALRRQRGLERQRSGRRDDADYWLHAAPVAVKKACALRRELAFAPLP